MKNPPPLIAHAGVITSRSGNWVSLLVATMFMGCVCQVQGEFTFKETENRLILRESGTPVLAFNHGETRMQDGEIGRSGYIHPLYGLDGDILTDDFPADHVHHRGAFFGWPQMSVLGEQVDLWHLRGLRPRFHKWGERHSGAGRASFEARNLWWLAESDEPAVEERLRFIVHASDDLGRAIDIHATFANLTAMPIILRGQRGSGYGGFNVRIDGRRPDVIITTRNGVLSNDANTLDPPSPWADHSSRPEAEAAHSGVAIFQHPDNPDFPVRSWTLRRYGFLGAAWPGDAPREIAAGESLTLRYRLFVHRGDAAKAHVADRFAEFLKEERQ